ncbi:MAG TPA: hypothetical protein VGM90_24575 [Kofleriaceae bacterium]|jgi:hypothetical protein
MKSLLALCAAVTLVACQKGEASENAPSSKVGPVSNVSTEYTKDIENLCDSIKRSGAEKEDAEARQLLIANWLAANLKTDDAHKFLVHIQPMEGNAKAQVLEDEAKRLGLAGCPLANEWKPK